MSRPTAITSLKDSDPKGKKNWLIYADSGVGKTVLAGTAPKALFLTVEAAGTESAKAFGSTADEWIIESFEELEEARDWIKKEGHKQYEWVIIDSISEMEELCFKARLAEAKKRNKKRNEDQPALQDYQIVYNRMKRLIDEFNRLKINCLYTAQTMRIGIEDEDDEDEETTLLLPLVGSTKNGVVAQKICGKVTLVGYLQAVRGKKKTTRRLYVEGGKRYVAKDRHDTFGRFIDNPNIEQMAEAVTTRQSQKNTKKKESA